MSTFDKITAGLLILIVTPLMIMLWMVAIYMAAEVYVAIRLVAGG